jgi:hypothetical protein
MKGYFLSGLILFLPLMSVSSLYAEPNDHTSFSLQAGLANQSHPETFGKYWVKGFNMGAGLNIPLNRRISFQGIVSYSGFGLNNDAYLKEIGNPDARLEGGDISIFTLMVGIRGSIIRDNSKIWPYLSFGTGFFKISEGDMNYQDYGYRALVKFRPETDPGISIGGGLEFQLAPKTDLFFDINYVIGFNDRGNISFIPIRVGLAIW